MSPPDGSASWETRGWGRAANVVEVEVEVKTQAMVLVLCVLG